jgi:hypothetical protein
MRFGTKSTTASLIGLLLAAPVLADSTDARCDVYSKGSDQLDRMVPCVFSQRQGFVTITLDDGARYELEPVGDTPGNFRDQNGKAAFRQSGLGTEGQIFRLADESIFVYWSTAALNPSDADNPTAPFSTKDYDATALLRCKAADEVAYGNCPAGILRMENSQASIVVQSRLGEQFTINFLADYVNATNHEVEARLDGDTWTVTLDNGEVYQVPLAAIEGG